MHRTTTGPSRKTAAAASGRPGKTLTPPTAAAAQAYMPPGCRIYGRATATGSRSPGSIPSHSSATATPPLFTRRFRRRGLVARQLRLPLRKRHSLRGWSARSDWIFQPLRSACAGSCWRRRLRASARWWLARLCAAHLIRRSAAKPPSKPQCCGWPASNLDRYLHARRPKTLDDLLIRGRCVPLALAGWLWEEPAPLHPPRLRRQWLNQPTLAERLRHGRSLLIFQAPPATARSLRAAHDSPG